MPLLRNLCVRTLSTTSFSMFISFSSPCLQPLIQRRRLINNQLQAPGGSVQRPKPWGLSLDTHPELDSNDYPLIDNRAGHTTSGHGASTVTEAGLVSESENEAPSEPASRVTGSGRGQHSNKRSDANGDPQLGPSKYLSDKDGVGISKAQKQALPKTFFSLCNALLAEGKEPDT